MIKENVQITIATSDESEQVIDLLKDSARWLHANHIDQWSYLRNGGEDDEIREAIHNQQTYVLKIDNKIVGTFTLYDKPNEWDTYIWGSLQDDAIYLHRFAVIREDKYKGYGAKIIRWIETEWSGLGKKFIRLDCVAGNEKLNKYYQGTGFKKIGENHDHCMYEKHIL